MVRGTYKHRHGAEARLVRSEREVVNVSCIHSRPGGGAASPWPARRR